MNAQIILIIALCTLFYIVAWVSILNNFIYSKGKDKDTFTFVAWIILHILLLIGIIVIFIINRGRFL